jgi:hypothetical protein
MQDWQDLANDFYQISVEKHNISEYLLDMSNFFDDPTLVDLCIYESDLLAQESENWSILGGYFINFMKKGVFLSLPRALIIINKMKAIVEKIITIEEAIIAGPP